MNNANQTDSELLATLSSLEQYFFPKGMLIKSIETLSSLKENIIALDHALLQLSKTSNFSSQELEYITEKAFELGDALGKTELEVLSSITAASSAGYDLQESIKLAEEALKLTNISSSITDTEKALEHLEQIIKNFGKDSNFASKINDAILGVANTDAINFDTLMEGAYKLSDASNNAGMSLEEMIGLLTAAYQTIGDMDKVEGSMPTIFSNLKEVYKDTENVYDIFDKLSASWGNMDAPSRDAFLSFTIDENQQDTFTAIMDNWALVEQSVYSASNSFGSADSANKTYLDSIEGRTKSLKNQLHQLSDSLINSDFTKFFLELGTSGAKALDNLLEKLGSFSTLGTLGAGYLSSKGVG